MTQWVTRAQWGAPQKVNCTGTSGTEGVAIHWMGPGSWAGKDPKGVVKQVRGWHLANKAEGYCDIAYSLAVDEGVILEGRSTAQVPKIRTGANGNAAANKRYYSVLVIAGDKDAAVSEETLRTAGEAVAWLRKHANAGSAVVGHRDCTSTQCPGDFIYSQLRKIAAYASGDSPPISTQPPPATVPPTLYRDGYVYRSKLKYGQRDSDSVRNLQAVLRGHGYTGPITGNYLDQTDAAVRACQKAHGFGADPLRASYVGPRQASHLFPTPPYTVLA